jgi:hypothetical protein
MPLPLLPLILTAAGASAIHALGNVWSAHITNRGNQQLQREQNKYNAPENQMLRLQRAGLNPMLTYGQSSGNVAGNQASYQPYQAPDLSPLGNIGNYVTLLNNYMQMTQIDRQNNLLDAQADLARSQSQYYEVLNPKTRKQTELIAKQIGLTGSQTSAVQHNVNIAQQRGRLTTEGAGWNPMTVLSDYLSRTANYVFSRYITRGKE